MLFTENETWKGEAILDLREREVTGSLGENGEAESPDVKEAEPDGG